MDPINSQHVQLENKRTASSKKTNKKASSKKTNKKGTPEGKKTTSLQPVAPATPVIPTPVIPATFDTPDPTTSISTSSTYLQQKAQTKTSDSNVSAKTPNTSLENKSLSDSENNRVVTNNISATGWAGIVMGGLVVAGLIGFFIRRKFTSKRSNGASERSIGNGGDDDKFKDFTLVVPPSQLPPPSSNGPSQTFQVPLPPPIMPGPTTQMSNNNNQNQNQNNGHVVIDHEEIEKMTSGMDIGDNIGFSPLIGHGGERPDSHPLKDLAKMLSQFTGDDTDDDLDDNKVDPAIIVTSTSNYIESPIIKPSQALSPPKTPDTTDKSMPPPPAISPRISIEEENYHEISANNNNVNINNEMDTTPKSFKSNKNKIPTPLNLNNQDSNKSIEFIKPLVTPTTVVTPVQSSMKIEKVEVIPISEQNNINNNNITQEPQSPLPTNQLPLPPPSPRIQSPLLTPSSPIKEKEVAKEEDDEDYELVIEESVKEAEDNDNNVNDENENDEKSEYEDEEKSEYEDEEKSEYEDEEKSEYEDEERNENEDEEKIEHEDEEKIEHEDEEKSEYGDEEKDEQMMDKEQNQQELVSDPILSDFVTPSQSNMKIEIIDNEIPITNINMNSNSGLNSLKALPISSTTRPFAKPTTATNTSSSGIFRGPPPLPLFDIEALKRHAEKVKNVKATVVAKKQVHGDSNDLDNNTNKDTNDGDDKEKNGPTLARKKSVRFQSNDNITETAPRLPSTIITSAPEKSIMKKNKKNGPTLARKKSVRFQSNDNITETAPRLPSTIITSAPEKSIMKKNSIVSIKLKWCRNSTLAKVQDEDHLSTTSFID
ncbi:19030_t:CDS:10 [Entrophospora sp. SA101]|nr:19030_t:CDS:10 [Entrophospora sp. SA101]